MSINLEHVNLTDYPIDDPNAVRYRELTETYRDRLVKTGLITLDNFLTEEGVNAFRDEIYARLPNAFHSVHGAQGYFQNFPGGYPEGIVGSDTFCMGHHLLRETAMEALYQWAPARQFIAALTGNDEVFLHEDPANALVVQLYKPGCWTGWHFDRAIFTTIINLGEPASGGVLECATDIRTEQDPSYDDVREVLYERSDKVRRHQMEQGSLTLMLGRYSIHRVTPVAPGPDRISLVLKYETQPGVYISAADRKWIYGPSAPGPAAPDLVADN